MVSTIRIGTRESQLAVWQATKVSQMLTHAGHPNELVYISSAGDQNLTTPLYEMGVQGIFSRSLDIALLENRIDIAVHSMKDVPVVLAKGLAQAAVLERASSKDLMVPHPDQQFDADAWATVRSPQRTPDRSQGNRSDGSQQIADHPFLIATSSLRRQAQWLNRYPSSSIENLRGNVNTRLRKLAGSNWDGAIFAAAGLERIGLRPENAIDLDWMLPAPAQGAILVMCRLEDTAMMKACAPLNHEPTARCVKIERDFLKTLMGGCTAPISASATFTGERVRLQGQLLSVDGRQRIDVEQEADTERSYSLGVNAALEVLDNGGEALMKEIRSLA